MKKPSIRYRKLAEGIVKITSIEGVMSISEIISEKGMDVRRIYGDGYPFMDGDTEQDGHQDVTIWKGQYSRVIIREGMLLNSKEFGDIIKGMKACGARLSKIIKDVAEAEKEEEKTIEI